MKTCITCKQSKPLSEFYKALNRKDSHQTCCKSCQRAYRKTKKGKSVNRKADNKYRQTEKGKISRRVWQNQFHAHNPNYQRALSAVNYAVRTGKLPQPDSLQCHYGEHPAQEYHHYKGYEPEHRLDVVPVCRKCHRKIHINRPVE